MFTKEFNYFIQHQDELVKAYEGKVIVLKDESVLGAFDTPLQAYLETKKEHTPGSFMIQPCEPGTDAYTVTISSLDLSGN